MKTHEKTFFQLQRFIVNHQQESKNARLNDVYVKLLKRLELGHKAALGVGRDNLRLLGEAYDDDKLPDLMVRCEKRAALLQPRRSALAASGAHQPRHSNKREKNHGKHKTSHRCNRAEKNKTRTLDSGVAATRFQQRRPDHRSIPSPKVFTNHCSVVRPDNSSCLPRVAHAESAECRDKCQFFF